MSGDADDWSDNFTSIDWARLPFQERVADHLANILFHAGELLDMFRHESGSL